MKKISLMQTLLALLLVLALPALAVAQETAQQKTYVVGFAQDNMANDWRAAQVRAVQKALAKHKNISFLHTDAAGNTAKNVLDVEDLIDQGIDVLVISPRDAKVMSPAIARAYRQGIAVVLLTRGMIGEDYTTFISPDDATIARQAADYMAEILNGKGRILVLQGLPTASTAIKRTEGFVAALKAHPGLKIMAVKPANYLRAEAVKVVQAALEQGQKFDAIYAQSDSMAAGARLALKAAGIDPASVPVVGIDYIPEARDAIRSGVQAASFTYPTCGREAADVVVKILNGESVPRAIEVPSVRVTRDNVDAVDTVF